MAGGGGKGWAVRGRLGRPRLGGGVKGEKEPICLGSGSGDLLRLFGGVNGWASLSGYLGRGIPLGGANRPAAGGGDTGALFSRLAIGG